MTNEEYHKALTMAINKNRMRLVKLKKAIAAGGLTQDKELEYKHTIIKLTCFIKRLVAEENLKFGGPY